MKKVIFSIITIFLLFNNNEISFSQENETPENIYIINSYDFEITGNTHRFALILAGELTTGVEITGLSKLEEYIQHKTQILYNQRVLESVEIEYTIGEITEDGKYPVDILVKTKDTWNIIGIPQPQYSSNTGFDVTLKLRDYNFLGTMSALRIDIGYQNDENNDTFFNLMTDSNTPFSLFNLTWYFRFYNYLEYSPDMPEPWHYKNTTGLSLDFPIKKTILTLGFYESLFFNDPNSNRNIDLYNLPLMHEGLYLQSRPFISWKIPTGFTLEKYGDINYTPNIETTFNHEFSEWPLDITRKGPFLKFNHNITFGRIDWIQNFQNGLSFNASNTYNYDFHRDNLNSSINISGIFHKNFEHHFGISSRFMYRQWFNYDYGYESAGDVLRGIIDKDVKADFMFSANIDLTLGLIRFRPSSISPKLRIMDFDFHLAPFLDAAVFRSDIVEAKYPDAHFSYKNLLFTSGVEVIVFPNFFRSLHLRASLGFNTSTLSGLSSREIYIGTELHY